MTRTQPTRRAAHAPGWPRYRTNDPWADVTLDLRAAPHARLPVAHLRDLSETLTARTPAVAAARWSGPEIDAEDPQMGLTVLTWVDTTGFRAALVADPAAQSWFTRPDHVLPHLEHVLKTTEPRTRDFVNHMDSVRTVLTDPAFADQVLPSTHPSPSSTLPTDPVTTISLRGIGTPHAPAADWTTAPVPPPAPAAMYRLAWASVGVTDLTLIPQALRDWDRTVPGPADRDNPAVFPPGLTVRGPQKVATFQRLVAEAATAAGAAGALAGMSPDGPTPTPTTQAAPAATPDVLAAWMSHVGYDLDDLTHRRKKGSTSRLQGLAEWHAAGFTPDEYDTWGGAALFTGRPTRGESAFSAAQTASLRERGVTVEDLIKLRRAQPFTADTETRWATVQDWLALDLPRLRLHAYLAAGLTPAEAADFEAADTPPTLEQLETVAALLPNRFAPHQP